MNQLLSKRLYNEIIQKHKIPYLITNIENYNISPDAVKNLRFHRGGISFLASFEGNTRHVSYIWEDVEDIIVDPYTTEDQDY